MLVGRAEQHDSYIEEVEQNSSNGAPKGLNVAPADALAKEDTVMVILFNAHLAIVAMIRITLRFYLAYSAINEIALTCS